LTQDAAQSYDWQALGLELKEENPPWLASRQRPELLDFLYFRGISWINSEFLSFVFESKIFEVACFNGPIEFITQVFDKRGECFY
jgi:hypothetical protein